MFFGGNNVMEVNPGHATIPIYIYCIYSNKRLARQLEYLPRPPPPERLQGMGTF